MVAKQGTPPHILGRAMLRWFRVMSTQASLRCGCRPYRSRACREGEDARCFLVECSERFLRRNALEGYNAHAQAGVLAIRADVEAGRADVPAADIVAAEIKQVGRPRYLALERAPTTVAAHAALCTLHCKPDMTFMWLHGGPTLRLHASLADSAGDVAGGMPCNADLVRHDRSGT